MDYRGERTGPAVRDWAVAQLPNHVAVLSSQPEVDAFLRRCASGKAGGARWGVCALLFTAKTATTPLYKSLALRYKDKIAFAEVRGPAGSALAAPFGVADVPALAVVCSGNADAVVKYDGAWGFGWTGLSWLFWALALARSAPWGFRGGGLPCQVQAAGATGRGTGSGRSRRRVPLTPSPPPLLPVQAS